MNITDNDLTCSICLENIKPKRLPQLNLNCQCKYNVHLKCFNNWWRNNKNCIICHERCGRAKGVVYRNQRIHKNITQNLTLFYAIFIKLS